MYFILSIHELITPLLVKGSVSEFKNQLQIILTHKQSSSIFILFEILTITWSYSKTQQSRSWSKSNKTYLLVSGPSLLYWLVWHQLKPGTCWSQARGLRSHTSSSAATSSVGPGSSCLCTAGLPRSFAVIGRSDAPPGCPPAPHHHPQTSTPAATVLRSASRGM